jgi:hypothetical protein
MHIEFIEIQNFRKLRSIRIDFAPDTTLFVGANNSGKTSAMSALRYFLVDKGDFHANDFTLSNWIFINNIGKKWEADENTSNSPAPSIDDWETVLPSLDLWLKVADEEIHRVSHIVPTLDWTGGLLGVRLRFEPKKIEDFYKEYLSAIHKAKETMKTSPQGGKSGLSAPVLWPQDMRQFLDRKLGAHFGVCAYCLDPTKQIPPENGIARPQRLPGETQPIDGDPLKGLVRIRRIDAQRDFADVKSGRDRPDNDRGGEKHRLTKQLRAYYDKHLDPGKSPGPLDLEALSAIRTAEELFDVKLKSGFSSALGSGKTRSLVNALTELRKEDNKSGNHIRLYGKKIGVITYTNAACDEIKRRLEFDPLAEVSTIHSFVWSLISGLQADIKQWLRTNLPADIAELEELQRRGRAGTKAALDRDEAIKAKRRRLASLDTIRGFKYNPAGDNRGLDSLSHSEVIQIGADFLTQKPLMQRILVTKFPILLIDESQDTNKSLMEAFLKLQREYKEQFCLGLFGDVMQRIYADGKEDLGRDLPADWARPAKKLNHRCPRRIIRLINRVRASTDGHEQVARPDSKEGIVRLFILRSDPDKKRKPNFGCWRRWAQLLVIDSGAAPRQM